MILKTSQHCILRWINVVPAEVSNPASSNEEGLANSVSCESHIEIRHGFFLSTLRYQYGISTVQSLDSALHPINSIFLQHCSTLRRTTTAKSGYGSFEEPGMDLMYSWFGREPDGYSGFASIHLLYSSQYVVSNRELHMMVIILDFWNPNCALRAVGTYHLLNCHFWH